MTFLQVDWKSPRLFLAFSVRSPTLLARCVLMVSPRIGARHRLIGSSTMIDDRHPPKVNECNPLQVHRNGLHRTSRVGPFSHLLVS